LTRPKPAEKRQRRGSPSLKVLAAPKDEVRVVPFPPTGLLPDTLRAWDAYWSSELALSLTLVTDLPGLRRLFRYYDDLERSWTIYTATPEVIGSTGQTRISHFAKHIAEMEPLIRALEDRFGLSPRSRLELGVTLGDAARSLEDLYREAAGDESVPDDLFVQGTAVRIPAR